MIVQSWEFGGYKGDKVDLLSRYASALKRSLNTPYVRGDCNQDDMVNIADAIFILNQLFVQPAPERFCDNACDTNGDLSKNIADAIFLLNHLFIPESPDPPAPFPDCGRTENDAVLGCDSYDCP